MKPCWVLQVGAEGPHLGGGTGSVRFSLSYSGPSPAGQKAS